MGAQDENNRGNVREKTKLRSTVAQEPSGSYSYHDESRVETVSTRASAAPKATPANDTSPAPRAGGKFAKSTMVGGFAAPLAPERAKELISPTITRSDNPNTKSGRPLSEPPEIGSWPPLPNVPQELEGRADDMRNAPSNRVPSELPFDDDDADDLAPTDPPKATKAANAIGGAIWEVVGPVVTTERERSDPSPKWSEPPDAEPEAIPPVMTPAATAASPEPLSHEAAPKKKEPHALIGDRMSAAGVAYRDHDLEKWENLVERGAWEQLAHDLGTTPNQSPSVHLLHVIAKREILPADDKGAGKLTQEAIQALADLLGVPASSPTALMLAKRLLRRNPVWTATQPATGVSLGIVFVGLAAGAGIGWLVTKLLL